MTQLVIPELAVVAMVGASGSGKTTFARRHFKPTEVLSSDFCRGLVSDDENNQQATGDAFDLLFTIARKRLDRRLLTVIDATNVQTEARKAVLALAREKHAMPVAIVLDVPTKVCLERSQQRSDRSLGAAVVRQQCSLLRQSLRELKREGFRYVYVLRGEEIEAATIERARLWSDRREDRGPFDIIGDVHGCFDELLALLGRLGYAVAREGEAFRVSHPQGRRAIFLGDLVDRGPKIVEVLQLVMDMVAAGAALCVPGNHEMKLLRYLRGSDVKPTHGFAETAAQLAAAPPAFGRRVERFIDSLVSHYTLDGERLVVAHAGLKESLQGRASGAVRQFALFGETTGETDEFGLPVRHDWAREYRGRAIVVYGHTPVPTAEWLNRTICVDTGCVYGGALTALRYPELELASEPARRVYCESIKPLKPPPERSAQQEHDELLDLADLLGKRNLSTRLRPSLTISAEHGAAALEVMSRFAVDPRWLIYLPPTMSPSETSQREGLLEHPAEALAYYREAGVGAVVCEQKHMGSRAVVIVGRSPGALERRFGAKSAARGVIYSRTGRPFFTDAAVEAGLLERVADSATAIDLWGELDTDWLCLDCEILPWSAKAQALLREQYAPTGAAGEAGLQASVAALRAAAERGVEVASLLAAHERRLEDVRKYRQAYRRYCWPVEGPGDYKIAPFHLLASEGGVHVDRDHVWHLETLARLCAPAPETLLATPYRVVDTEDEESCAGVIAWWEALTAAGGEGMVVKPFEFVAKGPKGLMQPAIKCRGPEYLRIIYGPEYTAPEHLGRLRERGLGSKRSLAIREFALGIEALERFVRREPLRRVHECVFAVLALESEPVDPRL
ncbi:polynucleotide 3'-phosphatase/polynucleotide 5'-hydroxyl-kinase/polynucleotide 2',3'-cyclic phosphate phosphodiesterase [Nannocystis exedens]|uniref:Polynucleotide 3'-phosphatase/polynucleotide 5'-hydroxyl-kinase/polynucleotide 2',3'-cyclic phosphate phosphodiesterase n=1 Tax=Nannocystis exedens TaxID=54 RepID=A0A1I2CQC4_9BACT|nr:polynucleotide kinase-phosphatase [Nannocystis exedens]PCC68491.1 polynucleotide kinase-phosphatase [Nannocystis exedens]SFE70434.1 polynucleotide 3'-phosphatase/polynucleotide 5'-hydroxyl-kinase/polynucleotide 2',3'-cyclic phosphate phosphodiesterase [Nannocystis exedens]